MLDLSRIRHVINAHIHCITPTYIALHPHTLHDTHIHCITPTYIALHPHTLHYINKYATMKLKNNYISTVFIAFQEINLITVYETAATVIIFYIDIFIQMVLNLGRITWKKPWSRDVKPWSCGVKCWSCGVKYLDNTVCNSERMQWKPGRKVWNVGRMVWNHGRMVWNLAWSHVVKRNPGHMVWNLGHVMWKPGRMVWSIGHMVWNHVHMVWHLAKYDVKRTLVTRCEILVVIRNINTKTFATQARNLYY